MCCLEEQNRCRLFCNCIHDQHILLAIFSFVLLLHLMCSKNVSHLNEYSVCSDPKISHLFFASTRTNIDNKINKILLNLIIRKPSMEVEYIRSVVVLADILFPCLEEPD